MDLIRLAALEKKLLEEPLNHQLRIEYIRCLMTCEKHDEALKQISIVLKITPNDPDLHLLNVTCFYEIDQLDKARESYFIWKSIAPYLKSEWDEVFKSPPKLKLLGSDPLNARHTNEANQAIAESRISFDDVIGMEDLKEELRLKIIFPFKNPEIYAKYKKSAGGGIMLFGPPGCGKTMIARAIAAECRAHFISVSISDILAPYLGQSESNLAAFFERARTHRPSVLFFDELDALAISRSKVTGGSMRQVINEFLIQLDGMNDGNEDILILGATNMPWDVDSAMKRSGRFARQIFIPPPDIAARERMISSKLKDVPHESMDFKSLAKTCEFFSGADIDGALDRAKEIALMDFISSHVETKVKAEDIIKAIKNIQPMALEWLNSVKNIVKYGNMDKNFAEVESYLKKHKLI